MDDITELDPYRADATVEERTDHVIGTLLCDEDPVRRYHTIQALQDGRLREAAAISLRQLRDSLGSTEAAATAVGVSRQAVNELLTKAGAPGAREDRTTRDKPTYWYGEYLAAVADIADTLLIVDEKQQGALKSYDLVAKGSQTTAVIPALDEAARRWLKALRHRDRARLAEQRADLLSEYTTRIADWLAARTDPHLTIAEQAEVWIGYSAARVRWRQQRAERRTA